MTLYAEKEWTRFDCHKYMIYSEDVAEECGIEFYKRIDDSDIDYLFKYIPIQAERLRRENVLLKSISNGEPEGKRMKEICYQQNMLEINWETIKDEMNNRREK